MTAQSNVARWRVWAGGLVKVIALLIFYRKAMQIPNFWIYSNFGDFMGKEADFLRSALGTVVVILLAGILLSVGRWLDGRWGTVFWVCMSISVILLVQDSVLAWAVWGV